MLVAAVKPALPYLDLPQNNAVDLALDAGDCAVRLRSGAEVAMSRIPRNACERAMRRAT